MKCTGYAILKVLQGTPRNTRSRIYKVMNGTTVTIRGRRYRSRGLIESVNGIKLAESLYAIPYEEIPKVLEIFREKNLDQHIQITTLCTCVCV